MARRGNLQYRGSNMYKSINIEHLECSMLTRVLHSPSVVQEIATLPPLWATPRNDTVVGTQLRRFRQLDKL